MQSRKALPGFASTRRLDRGVERKQDCLTDDGADEIHHLANLLRGLIEAARYLVGLLGLSNSVIAGVPA